jgi:beta-lactamase regulating signal transducer with metallopeptidase domain
MDFYAPLAEWSKWAWFLLANHLWQATLFFLFALAVSLSLKRAPARVRYSLWLVALTKFILPCAAFASLINYAGLDLPFLFASENGRETGAAVAIAPFLSPVTSPSVLPAAVGTAKPGLATPALTYAATAQNQGDWYSVLILIWIVGCLLLVGLWLRKTGLLSAMIRSGEIVRSGREFESLERVRSWLGLRRQVTLIISPRIAEPGVWRVLRPTVVLPAGISDRLSDSELETILMHELIHVERWDNLIGFIQRAACCLLWFHPLVWLLDRQLLAEREQSCDDAVIRMGGDSDVYASGIKKICRHSIGWELTGLSGAAGSDLKKRIKRILEADIIRTPSVLHRMLLGATVCVLVILSIAVGQINREEVRAQSNTYDLNGVDYRFVAVDAKAHRGKVAVTGDGSRFALLPLPTTLPPTRNSSDAPVRIEGQSDKFEPVNPGVISELNQPQPAQPAQPDQPKSAPAQTSAPAPAIAAAIIPVSAVQIDLTEFVGRYEVDPAVAENYVLDITLEHGGLWLKPSHTSKRKLIQTGETTLSDIYGEFRFTALQGSKGRIIGLRIDSWNSNITARKLSLPQPSLKGNTVFRLSGHPEARIVAVAGSFNDWNQSQFLFSRVDGEWICRINLPPGKYEYKFIVDGNWLVDPRNPKTIHDERGHENSVLIKE